MIKKQIIFIAFSTCLLFSNSSFTQNKPCIKSAEKFMQGYSYWKNPPKISNYCGDINEIYNGWTLLMSAVYEGKHYDFIEDCLQREADIFLYDDDTIRPQNACNYITWVPIYDPPVGERDLKYRKNEEDMIHIIKLFVKYHPKDEYKIYEEALWTLITYNHPEYTGKVFDYLMGKITKYNTKSNIINHNIITRDSITKMKWNEEWKQYVNSSPLKFLK